MSARIKSIWQRLKYEAHVFFIDHGMFRALYCNKAQIAPGVYRSNYPTSAQIMRLKRQGVNRFYRCAGSLMAHLTRWNAMRVSVTVWR